MKYPEAVYRIGNEFKILEWDKRFVFVGFLEGRRHARLIDKEKLSENLYYGEEQTARTTSLKLCGITAETLAELARENENTLYIRFDAKGFTELFVGTIAEPNGEREMAQNKDEPLGEFFLGAALERKYLIK